MSLLTQPWNDIVSGLITAFTLAGLGGIGWAIYKYSLNQGDKFAIETYEKELAIIKQRLDRIEKENKEKDGQITTLNASLNQLKGENNLLKETLALRDPNFKESLASIVEAIKDLRDDFRLHVADDKVHFGEIINLLNNPDYPGKKGK